jgi:hypothetical protein
MTKYQNAKRKWKEAKRRGLYGQMGEFRKAMRLAELEMVAYGAPGVWCCAVVPFSKTWHTIREGRITPKMKAARDELARAGRWPIRG